MKPRCWTAADLAEKGYREVFGKYGKVSGGEDTKTRMRGRLEGQPPNAVPRNTAREARQATEQRDGLHVVAQPVSSPASSSHYKSKWEASYAGKLDLEQRAGIITRWWYEPFSLWLPGKVRYKPDFLIQYNLPMCDPRTMELSIIEVKGWSKNKRDGMTRLKIAAALFPCFRWVLASHTKNGWEEVAP